MFVRIIKLACPLVGIKKCGEQVTAFISVVSSLELITKVVGKDGFSCLEFL